MSYGKLYFTIGISRSGKSTYCDQWVRRPAAEVVHNPNGPDEILVHRPRVVVAGDDIRRSLGRGYEPRLEGLVFAIMDVSARAFLGRGFDVILDETATTEATISRYLKIDASATPVWIETPAYICIERAAEEHKSYLVPTIVRHAAQYAALKTDWAAIWQRLQAEVSARQRQDVTV